MTVAVIITLVYGVAVWLVFFKYRWLKFSIVWGVVSFWFGVHLFLIFIIALRFYEPYSIDAHVIRQTIQLIPRLPEPTLLKEVLFDQNTPVKEGQPLYQFDTSIYEAKLRAARAQLVLAQQNAAMLQQDVQIASEQLTEADANQSYAQGQVDRYTGLVPKGGAKQETLDEWRDKLTTANAQVAQAQGNLDKAQLALNAQVDGVNAQVVEAQANVDQAAYFLEQTTLKAPEDGIIVSQQARPGLVVGDLRIGAIAVLVADADPYLLAGFYQEHLKFVEPGQEAEVALDLYPGQIFKAKVVSIWEGTGQGQLKPSGEIPTFRFPRLQGRFAVEIKLDDDQKMRSLPAGAHGAVAIYTGKGEGFSVLRRVNIRLYAWANFLFPFDFL